MQRNPVSCAVSEQGDSGISEQDEQAQGRFKEDEKAVQSEGQNIEEVKKLERRINQLINSLTKLMSKLDEEENISVSLLGDLTDLRRSAQTGDKNKVASQKINQMPYSKIETQHSYKSLMSR
ncbi:hypothetical protein SAMN02746089_02147 [Caldanaerobius fijiensis DSM 17918]|uniref:Uncharacterized protein n=1 Tax=Caldanaerobius fijiensis DSM 17918 TaxID=1121256 RepID=A0A1M5CLP4_9THEO|nr:hypothetical protein [Caldanaerobius fijiensis]SHF55621.1 hypothetical protein SAMN02746089_02147 [Caldanaerobius fijiensis DSM 17918]